MLMIHQLKNVLLPIDRGGFKIPLASPIENVIVFLQHLQFGQPGRNNLLEAAKVGLIVLDNIPDPEAPLTDGMSVGVVIATQIKGH
jgi:hypothetical protein